MNGYLSKIRVAAILFTAAYLSGCASLVGTFGTYDPYGMENKIYVGVRGDLDIISGECRDCFGGDSWVPFAIIDLPLSMALDTLFLPFTVAYYFDESNPAKRMMRHPRTSSSSGSSSEKSQSDGAGSPTQVK